jgi:hypothetical protein
MNLRNYKKNISDSTLDPSRSPITISCPYYSIVYVGLIYYYYILLLLYYHGFHYQKNTKKNRKSA